MKKLIFCLICFLSIFFSKSQNFYFNCSGTSSSHIGSLNNPFTEINMSLIADPNSKYIFSIIGAQICDFPSNYSEFSGNLEMFGDPSQGNGLKFNITSQMFLRNSSLLSFYNMTIEFQNSGDFFFYLAEQSSINFSGCNINFLNENLKILNAQTQGIISFIDTFISMDIGNEICQLIFGYSNSLILKNLTCSGLIFSCPFISIMDVSFFNFLNSQIESNVFSSSFLVFSNANNLNPFESMIFENLTFFNNTKNQNASYFAFFTIDNNNQPLEITNLNVYENSFFDLIIQLNNTGTLNMSEINVIENYNIGQYFSFSTCLTIFLSNFSLNFNSGNQNTNSYGTFLSFSIILSGIFENFTILNNTSFGQISGMIIIQSDYLFPLYENNRGIVMKHFFFANNNAFFSLDNTPDLEGGFLYVKGPTNLTIECSNFINNQVENAGNTIINYIYVTSSYQQYFMALIFINCSFNGNMASNSVNGINFPGEQISIYNSSFENQQGGDYGIFYLNSYNAIFVNNTFKNCFGTIGSIFYIFLNLQDSFYYFENVIFMNNLGTKSSVFLTTIYPFNMTYLNCYFSNNSVTKQGGVFFIKYSDGTSLTHIFSLLQSFFENNYASVSGGVGEMWQLGGQVNMFDCVFLNNTSSQGGVFDLNQEITTNDSLVNCLFVDNTAYSQAAVFNILCAMFYDNDSNYYYNQAEVAAIYFVSSYCAVTLQGSKIYQSSIGSLGNIVLVAKPIVNINDLYIYDSQASACAGLSFSGLVTLVVDGLSFFNNYAYRGTLFYSSSLLTTASLSNIVSVNNSATIGLSSFSFTTVIFMNMHFEQSSSVIFVIQYASITLLNILIEDHQCSLNQVGCFVNIISKSSINMTNITCYNVISLESLGIIYSSSSTISLYDSYFYNATVASVADIVYAEISQIFIKRTMIKYYKNSAFNLIQNSAFSFEDCICSNLNLVSLACLNISDTNNILISNSFFSNISCSVIYFSNDLDFLQTSSQNGLDIPLINNCSFSANRNTEISNNLNGGTIFVENSHINISNCTFFNNTAEIGGALLLSSIDVINVFFLKWFIEGNTFINNTALSSGGGAIFWDYNLPIIENNLYKYNAANFGINIATYPYRLNLTMNNSNWNLFELIMKNFSSGDLFPSQFLNFALLDYYNQTITSTYGCQQDTNAAIMFKDIYNIIYQPYEESSNVEMRVILGTSIVEFDAGFFNFNDLTLIALPNNTHTLTISTNLIQNFNASMILNQKENDQIINNSYFYVFNISICECQQGEIFNEATNICQSCSYGDYSLNINVSLQIRFFFFCSIFIYFFNI